MCARHLILIAVNAPFALKTIVILPQKMIFVVILQLRQLTRQVKMRLVRKENQELIVQGLLWQVSLILVKLAN